MMDSQPEDSLGAEAREETTDESQLPVATGEAWQIVEAIDDMVDTGQANEFMKNEFFYEFKQGNRIVRGLSASAYAHLALIEKITIDTMEVTKLKSGYEADAVAIKSDTNQQAFGTGYAPYFDSYGKLDVFAKQKAMTRAARNARKQLLPYQKVVEAISNLAGLPNTLPTATTATSQPALPAAQTQAPNGEQETKTAGETAEDTPLAKALRQGFAVYGQFKESLADIGVDETAFWHGVRDHYKVGSRKDMTEGQWNNLVNSLELVNGNGEPFAIWIRDLASESESEEEGQGQDTETKTETKTEDDDGFPF